MAALRTLLAHVGGTQNTRRHATDHLPFSPTPFPRPHAPHCWGAPCPPTDGLPRPRQLYGARRLVAGALVDRPVPGRRGAVLRRRASAAPAPLPRDGGRWDPPPRGPYPAGRGLSSSRRCLIAVLSSCATARHLPALPTLLPVALYGQPLSPAPPLSAFPLSPSSPPLSLPPLPLLLHPLPLS